MKASALTKKERILTFILSGLVLAYGVIELIVWFT